jgi:hypothetical protein
MAEQYPFVFFNASITNDATAVSIDALIRAAGYSVTGSCVSLNVTCNTDVYWGNASTVTNTNGALVASGIPVSDGAVGAASDCIPIARMFIFNHSGGTSTATIYARFIP